MVNDHSNTVVCCSDVSIVLVYCTMMVALIRNHLKSGQKCLDFEWPGFGMVGNIAMAMCHS